MQRFSHSLGISVGIHVTAAAVVLLILNFHPATPLPAASPSLANAIAVSIVPPPQPATPPQPREPPPPQAKPPVPQPPPQTIATQADQADVTTPPPQTIPAPAPPPQPSPDQSTPTEAPRYPSVVFFAWQSRTGARTFGDHLSRVISATVARERGFSVDDKISRPRRLSAVGSLSFFDS